MANSMFKRPAKIKLTLAQHRLFSEKIAEALALGDCRQRWFDLFFDDYEGANATLNSFLRMRPNTAREHVTWNSVIDRLNAAIRDAVKA